MAACEAMQVHGDDLIGRLRLPIGLRMECRRQLELDTCQVEKLTVERAGEDRVAIAHNGRQNPMQAHHIVEECACHRRRCVWIRRGMKCASLEKRSTTIKMTDLPLTLGSASTKSMAMWAPLAAAGDRLVEDVRLCSTDTPSTTERSPSPPFYHSPSECRHRGDAMSCGRLHGLCRVPAPERPGAHQMMLRRRPEP